MKKHGFTLAEVLVTLGIIGVVAALTTPALIQNVGNAKIAPRLQKAKATFETASEMMLNEHNSNTMLGVADNTLDLGNELSNYMKITHDSSVQNPENNYKTYEGNPIGEGVNNTQPIGEKFDSDEGMIYYINVTGKQSPLEYEDTPNNQYIGVVTVDINGLQTPNVIGKDTFLFALYNDGTLRPYGSKSALRHVHDGLHSDWSNSSNATACSEDKVMGGWGCTGSIFDNGMKVIYQ